MNGLEWYFVILHYNTGITKLVLCLFKVLLGSQ